MSIRRKLFVSQLILLSIGFVSLANWIVGGIQKSNLQSMEESMIDSAIYLSSQVSLSSKGTKEIDTSQLQDIFNTSKNIDLKAKVYQLDKNYINLNVYVTNNMGIVLFDSGFPGNINKDFSQWHDVKRTLSGQYGARATLHNPDDESSLALYVSAPILINNEIAGCLTVYKQTNSIHIFIKRARNNIIIGACIAFLALIILFLLTTTWITNPINKLHRYVLQIKEGKKEVLPKLKSQELKQLGTSFEDMRDTIEGKKYIENYIQTLTHEMKSPISAISGAAELLKEEMNENDKQKFLDNISSETDRLQNSVDKMLRLSSLESRKSLERLDEIFSQQLIDELVTRNKAHLESKKLKLINENVENINFKGDYDLVYTSLDNVLQNAIDFSQVEKEITLSIYQENNYCVITVKDEGNGIPEFALNKIYDKFYSLKRPSTGKKSSGLGLSIVQAVMSLHKGKVQLRSSQPEGVEAKLFFPKF